MSEELVDQEVQPEVNEVVEPVEPIVPPEEPVVEAQAEAKPSFDHNAYEDNVKSLRDAKRRESERAEQAEYERDQLARYLDNMQQQLGGQQQAKNDTGVADDDYVEGKDLGRVSKSVKELKAEVQQWKSHSEEMTAELKLSSEFSDFNNVVTTENVKALIKKYPELRATVQNDDPLYSRGKATYRLIKKFIKNSEPTPTAGANNSKVQSNMTRPRPTSSIKEQNNSPLSQANLFANGYTEEVGDALEKEMYDAIARR